MAQTPSSESDESTEEISRRNVLKSSAIIAGVSVADLDIDFNEAESLGSVHFVEAALRHRDAPNYPRGGGDNFLPYVIDEANDSLVLTKAARESLTETLKSEDSVVSYRGKVTSVPAKIFDVEPRSWLVAETGSRVFLSEGLGIEDTYAPPPSSVSLLDNGSVKVISDGRNLTVDIEQVGTLMLTGRSVRVRRKSEETKSVPDKKGEGEIEVAKRGPVESITITPELTIWNHGVLEIFAEKS